MSLSFLTVYINVLVILVLGTAITFMAVNSVRAVGAGLKASQVPRVMGGFVAILALWYALAVQVSDLGLMGAAPFAFAPPWVGLFFVGGALMLFALGRLIPAARIVIDATGQNYFMAIQSFRLLGVVFLIGGLTGNIPWLFALPAGLGDIGAGILGYRAMRAVNRQDPQARLRIRQANTVGLMDFAVALITGLLTSETIYQVAGFDAPNLVGAYPLVLIPALLVPVFLAAHLFSVQRLMQTADAKNLRFSNS